MTPTLWLAVAFAGAVSLLAPFALTPLLRRIGSFDVPNERSSHVTPTLRGGGLAPLAGWIVGMTVATLANSSVSAASLATLATGATAAAVLGLVEDLWGLSVVVRLGCQIFLGVAVAAALCIQIGATAWWALLLGLFIAWYINVANFMDGINGISSGHGLVAGAALAGMGVIAGAGWLAIAGAIIATTFIAFLPWNLRRPGIFLGDVGSYLLGAAVAMTASAAFLSGLPLTTVIAPLAVYLVDTGWTLGVRVLKRERWHEAHRTHVYQRLTDIGLSHVQVAAVVTGASVICAAIGLAALAADWIGQLWAAAAILVLLAVYLQSPHLVRRLKKVSV